MTDTQRRAAAKQFAADWQGKGYEKGHSQTFWLSLLQKVYGVEEPDKFITFEDQIMLDHTSFIDGFIPSTHVLIEQKSLGKELNKPIKQSDGSLLSPFQQAKRYAAELPYSQRPRWIVTCNFAEFYVYDMERPTGDPEVIKLCDLEKEYYRLQFLVDTGDTNIKKEMEVSLQAGEIVGVLYDALLKQYKDPETEDTLKNLNALCVRLVFCLYAEDADIFGSKSMFHDYLRDIPASGIRRALVELFRILDQKLEQRDKYLADDNPALAAFPYVKGGLFSDENIEIPPFTEELKTLLLERASEDFDWSAISPTIFRAVFESTLNPDTRRSGGMHYTSIENIHKVIDPLFLDGLRAELEEIKEIAVDKTRKAKLGAFQSKLAGLTFLDPACGSGNFLTETYLSLRKLENEVLRCSTDQISMDLEGIIQVSIGQFYGIEINDFAVTVAKTALWIAESPPAERPGRHAGVWVRCGHHHRDELRGGADEDVSEVGGTELGEHMDIPRLYKYRYFNEDTVSRDGLPNGEQIPQWHQVLYDGIIIPAAPETFNDPYDCDFLLEDNFLNSKAARNMLIGLLAERCAITSEEKNSIRNTDDLEKTLKEVLWKHFKARSRGLTKKLMETSISTIQRVKELLRVACFSEINDSILMWSHYSDNHKGFCIEYDLSDWDCRDHLKPVQYVNERHYIRSNFADNLPPTAGKEIMDAALYKSAEWSYEREWRLVMSAVEIMNPKFKGTIPALFLEDFITAVYIGTKAEEKYSTQICEHYRGTDVKVYRMQMQTDCYKLKPEQIQ